jgi:ABC-2 type transport system ATP-binding protein
MTLLANSGATVAATGQETLTVNGLPGERIAELLTGAAIPFSELKQHRASLESAYMELTRDAAEFILPMSRSE